MMKELISVSEPTFGKYVLSYGRAFTATTQLLVPDAVWVVRKSQEADYRAAGHKNILAVDDELIGGLCEVNNWIIDHNGVKLVYSLKAGAGCYWNAQLNGGTVLRITHRGVEEVWHEFVDVSHLV